MENRKTVLLADANEEFRGMLREAIEKSGEFDVTAVTGSGAQIQQLVHQYKPDLVVMDVALPELDGMNALAPAAGRGRPAAPGDPAARPFVPIRFSPRPGSWV